MNEQKLSLCIYRICGTIDVYTVELSVDDVGQLPFSVRKIARVNSDLSIFNDSAVSQNGSTANQRSACENSQFEIWKIWAAETQMHVGFIIMCNCYSCGFSHDILGAAAFTPMPNVSQSGWHGQRVKRYNARAARSTRRCMGGLLSIAAATAALLLLLIWTI